MVESLRQHKDNLFTCFREDHKVLGTGFHRLSEHLRARDTAGACAVAQWLDEAAGPHIAFEEDAFYPRLVPLFGRQQADRMYDEHRQGLAVIRALINHKTAEPLDQAACAELLEQSEIMEAHIADCAELFEAMGRIPVAEQQELHRKLLEWRRRQPKWTRYVEERRDAAS
jgi:hypothetical protein